MPRVTAPPHGSFWRVWKGYVEGLYIIDGRRRVRGLGALAPLTLTDSGRKRTAKQLEAAVWALWQARREELERELGPAGSARSILRMMQDWIDAAAADRQPGTVELYKATRSAYKRAVGDHPMQAFNLGHVDKLKAALTERELAAATINIHLRTLRTFLHWARERKALPEVPRIRQLEAPRDPPAAPTDEEVARLFAYLARRTAKAKADSRKRAYANAETAVWMAAYTGLRRGAICHLERRRIDLERRVIYPQTTGRLASQTKRAAATIIQAPLLAHLRAHFERFPSEAERYLLDNGQGEPHYKHGHALTVAISRVFAAKEVGLADRGIKPVHGFRAFRAKMLRQAGADLELIRDMLAHSDIRVTAGYFPDPAGAQWELIERMDDRNSVESESLVLASP